MCLVLIDWQPNQDNWINLVSNRDEFLDRPTLPLHPWKQAPNLYAGMDEQHKGTWFGFNKNNGRFAIITNVRAKDALKDGNSRGSLVKDILLSEQTVEEFIQQAHIEHYSSFNLLVGDRQALFYVSNYLANTVEYLNPGVQVLSNASLHSVWPKTQAARDSYKNWKNQQHQALVYLLTDTKVYPPESLPNTGIAKTLEQQLSAQFIRLPHYGTRSSHSLIGYKNQVEIREIQWDENGLTSNDVSFNLTI